MFNWYWVWSSWLAILKYLHFGVFLTCMFLPLFYVLPAAIRVTTAIGYHACGFRRKAVFSCCRKNYQKDLCLMAVTMLFCITLLLKCNQSQGHTPINRLSGTEIMLEEVKYNWGIFFFSYGYFIIFPALLRNLQLLISKLKPLCICRKGLDFATKMPSWRIPCFCGVW